MWASKNKNLLVKWINPLVRTLELIITVVLNKTTLVPRVSKIKFLEWS